MEAEGRVGLEWWSSGEAVNLQNAADERAFAPYRKENAP